MEHFQKIKLLNINKCSEIYLVKDIFSNELFVLKQLILVNCNTTEEKEHIKTEMKILNQISHQNIIISNINKPNSVVGIVPNMALYIIYNINNKYPKYYDEKVDIWSLGTLCYEMIFGYSLFINLSNKEIFGKILSADFKISHSVSKEARNFLECMLQKDPDKRLSA